MSALAELQRALAQHVLAGTDDIATEIRPGGIGVARRLAVYHNAYRMRLRDALRDSFGHTLLYLGDEAFDAAALAYIDTHPSATASLRDYGGDFSDWLPQHLADEPETGELAALDWALRHCFDGPDAPPLMLADLAVLSAADWAVVGLQLHPTCTTLTLRFNTLALWQAVDGEQDAPPPLPLQTPGELLIWRRGHQPHFRSLDPLETLALKLLREGDSFAQTCAALAQTFPERDTAAEAGALLRRWIDEELLCGLRRP